MTFPEGRTSAPYGSICLVSEVSIEMPIIRQPAEKGEQEDARHDARLAFSEMDRNEFGFRFWPDRR